MPTSQYRKYIIISRPRLDNELLLPPVYELEYDVQGRRTGAILRLHRWSGVD